MSLQVVHVLQAFRVRDYEVQVGARVMAWRGPAGAWVVTFNGNDVPVPEGTVEAVGTAPAKKEAPQVYSAARLEQYQVAPAKPA